MGQTTDWVPIYRTGDWAGKRRITPEELKLIAAGYNPAEHEAPVVIGHPGDDAPSYAWVEELKAEGDTLLGRYRDVEPNFAQMVNDRRFPKRSAAFYPEALSPTGELYLRHVGYLGAVPPAVKGLPDHTFLSGNEPIVYEFAGEELDRAKEKENKTDPTEKHQGAETPPEQGGIMDDLQKQKELLAAEETARKDAEKKLADVKKDAEEAKKKLEAKEAELENIASERRKDEHTRFVEYLCKEGKLTPAHKKAGVVEFMEALDRDEALTFAEGEGKVSRLDWFKKFLGALPVQVEFREKAPQSTDGGLPEAADDSVRNAELNVKVKAEIEKNPELSYTEALKRVKNKK